MRSFPGMPMKKLLFICMLGIGLRLGAADSDRIFTADELITIDRDNDMWRQLRVDEDVEPGVQRLKNQGFSEEDITRLRPQIEAIWTVELERNFGWLTKEAIEKIKAVDRGFIPRLRSIRLFETVGIQVSDKKRETMAELSREWQRAIQHELDYREIREFRFVNSASAQTVSRLVKGLTLTADEFRTLCQWQRDFDGQHTDNRFGGRSDRRAWSEDRLDHYSRIRSLLGDVRFFVYLNRAETDFESMNQALISAQGLPPRVPLDLWWVKRKKEIEWARTTDPAEWRTINERTRQVAESLIGEERFAQYSADESARWLR